MLERSTARLVRCAAVLALVLTLAACAAQSASKRQDLQLAELQARLPGRYDNTAQVRSEAQSAVAQSHAALDLLIAPANAALVGKVAYYVRETAAGDPRRVLSQRIWVLGRAEDLHTKQAYVEQHIYLFKEPQRWAHVGEQPELLESLLPEDLERLPGCELLWTKKDADKDANKDADTRARKQDKSLTADTTFVARRKSETCAPPAGPEGLRIEQRMELHDNQLALSEQEVGADGLIDDPAEKSDPFYRFVRRGAAN